MTKINFQQFVAIFLLLFLFIISLSSTLIRPDINIAFNIFEVLLITFLIAFILLKKIKNPSMLVLLLLIVAPLLHLLSIYLLLPIGFHADQRVYFVDEIKKYGKINVLEKYSRLEGTYYTRYPMPWLLSAFVSIITSTSSQTSQLTIYAVTYVCFIIFLVLTINYLSNKIATPTSIASIAIVLTLTIYLNRPFQGLIAGSFGLLSIIIIFYLYFRFAERSPIILLFIIPLVITHGLAIYVSTFMFLLLALSYLLIRASNKKILKALSFAVIIFIGTWLYQVGVQLIDMFVKDLPYRWDQLLNAMSSPLFERGKSSEVVAQNLHIVYPLVDFIITYLAYAFPVVAAMTSFIYFLHKFIFRQDCREHYVEIMVFSLISIIMFAIAAIFAWKGIENAIARYLYEYATLIATIVNILLIELIFKQENTLFSREATNKLLLIHNLKAVGLVVLLIIGVLIIFESFYTPYASPLFIPDKYKFERRYQTDYGLAIINRNLAKGIIEQILEAYQRKEVQVISIDQMKYSEVIIYNNDFIIIIKR